MLKKLFSSHVKSREISFINLYCYHKNEDSKNFEDICINITNQIINFLRPEINNLEGLWNTLKELVQNGIRPTYKIFREIEPEKNHEHCSKCGQLRFGTKVNINSENQEIILYLKNKAPRSEKTLENIQKKLNANKEILFEDNKEESGTNGGGLGIYLAKRFFNSLAGKLNIYWANGFYVAEITFRMENEMPGLPSVQQIINKNDNKKVQMLRRAPF